MAMTALLFFFNYDITFKPASQRMQLEEVGLSIVKDGKITREEFYYTMDL